MTLYYPEPIDNRAEEAAALEYGVDLEELSESEQRRIYDGIIRGRNQGMLDFDDLELERRLGN